MNPVLTVVVIVYNDAARLPRAVRSVLRQTLRDLEVVIVDDASTDGSAQVATQLASRNPDRVRVLRLPTNSGGCSRPRNTGIDAAAGRYVMFLDSDDELPRTACARLVETAEREQSDFVAGLCHRVHLRRAGEISPWYRWLYVQQVTYTSVLEQPGLLYDTLSTNKCYRRSFLDEHSLRFPEGYHYEDLLFSGQVYLHARRFTLIPDVVYRWLVVDDPETPSITNRRAELRNFEDRLRIHRLLDEAFAAHGADELKLHKDVKFLSNDLLLYLRDLRQRDAGYRTAFLDLAAGYVATLDRRAFTRVSPVLAIAAWLLLQRDEANLFTAIDYVAHGERLSASLADVDGQIYWTRDHLDDPEARALLDVTALGFHDRPLEQLTLAARATELEIEPRRLVLRGDLTNPLGRISTHAVLGAELVLTAQAGSPREVTIPMPRPRHDGDMVRWAADVDLTRALPASLTTRTWDVSLRLYVESHEILAPVAAADPGWDGRATSLPTRMGRALGDRIRTLVTPIGDLAVQVVPGTPVAAGIEAFRRRVLLSPRTSPVRSVVRRTRAVLTDPRQPRVREELFARILPRLPAGRRPIVVFESAQGRRCGGDPKAVYDEMMRRGLAVDAIWVVRDTSDGFPATRQVRHGSLRYFAALARAWAWVEDEGIAREAVKRAHSIYVQTGHGTPISWAGYDEVKLRRGAADDDKQALRRRVVKWDVVVVRSPFEQEVLARAFRHNAMPLQSGAPRNDRLVRPAPQEQTATRARLRLGDDDTVVVWVPSCERAVVTPSAQPLGPGQRLLVWHPEPDARTRGGRTSTGDTDVSHEDLSALLAIADVLVTDHHPAMLDLPLRRRPVVVVGCHCGVHASPGQRAAAYLDLADEAPGPVVWDVTSLADELCDVEGLRRRTLDRLDVAAERFGRFDTGSGAAAVVDELTRRWTTAPPGSAR